MKTWLNDHKKAVGGTIILIGVVIAVAIILL